MIDNKIFSGGKLNRDDDYHILPNNDWVDARNVRINSTANGYLGAFSNIKGTEEVGDLVLDGSFLVIGARGFDVVGRIFYFLCQVEGSDINNQVLMYDKSSNTTTILIDRSKCGDIDILNFSVDRRINHIDLVDEKYLFWVESARDNPVNPPRMADITKDYGVITNRSISAIKPPPLLPVENVAAVDDPSGFYNSIGDRAWLFKYRYIYWDNSKSSFSPASAIGNQRSRGNASIQTFCLKVFDSAIQFNFDGGGDLVKGIEIIGRGSSTSDWQLIASFDFNNQKYLPIYRLGMSDFSISYSVTFTVNGTPTAITGSGATALIAMNDLSSKFELSPLVDLIYKKYIAGANGLGYMEFTPILDTTTLVVTSTTENVVNILQVQNTLTSGNGSCLYTFTDSRNLGIFDQSEANEPFDYVPIFANAQSLPNGNYLTYGDYTEGYDNVNVDMTLSTYIKTIEKPLYNVTMLNSGVAPTQDTIFTFSGVFSNDVVLVYEKLKFVSQSSYINLYTNSFPAFENETEADFLNRFGAYLNNVERNDSPSILVIIIVDTSAKTVTLRQTIPSPAIYFESVILSRKMDSWYKGNSSYKIGLVYIDGYGRTGAVNVDSNNTFNVPTMQNYNFQVISYQPNLRINSLAPSWASKYAIVVTKSNSVSKFLQFGIAAPFIFNSDNTLTIPKKGIEEYNSDFNCDVDFIFTKGDEVLFFNSDGVVFTSTLKDINDDGHFVVNANGLSNQTFTNFQINRFEIRQKTNATDGVFYQVALVGDISAEGYHLAPLGAFGSSQTIDSPASIVVFNGDSIVRNVWLEPNATSLRESEWLEHYSFSDYVSTIVTPNIGTPNAINSFEKQTRYPSSIRFGGAYVVGSSINNINSFNQTSFKDFGLQYGAIQILDVDGNKLIVGQKLRIGVAPVFESMLLDKQGAETVAISERLINDISYYGYEAGIGDAPEAYTRFGSAKYFVDKQRGLVCRLERNGITPISISSKMNSYFNSILPIAESVSAGFDPENQEYVLTILSEGGSDTIAFSENSNGFTHFLDLLPTCYATLGQSLYAFDTDAKVYLMNVSSNYNTFFTNEAVPSSVTIVSNASPLIKKTFVSVSEIASSLWSVPELSTDLGQESKLSASRFAKLEGEFHASFMRDSRVTPGVDYPLINGNRLKGKWIKLKLENSNTDFVYLLSVGVKSSISPQTGV